MGLNGRCLVAVCLGAASLTGCGLYVVKKPAKADFHGIPFYVKTAGCKREISHLKPYYLVTLTTKIDDKTKATESKAVCRKDFTSKALQDLLEKYREGQDISTEWKIVKALDCDPGVEESVQDSRNWLLVSDTISSYLYVDYQNPYTLNVRRPIMGSASATTKLADDGTLSEGTAQVEDKTVETIMSMIPAADLIKGAAAALVKTTALPVDLKIEEKGVKFTRTYRKPDVHGLCESDTDLTRTPPATQKDDQSPLVTMRSDLVVEDLGAPKKADDSNTVKVDGSIQLPKAKDAKP